MVKPEAISEPGEVGMSGFDPIKERLGPLGHALPAVGEVLLGQRRVCDDVHAVAALDQLGHQRGHLGQHFEHARAAGVRLGGECGEDDRRRRELGVVLEVQVTVALEGLDVCWSAVLTESGGTCSTSIPRTAASARIRRRVSAVICPLNQSAYPIGLEGCQRTSCRSVSQIASGESTISSFGIAGRTSMWKRWPG